MKTATPLYIDVVTRVPTTFVQCWGCETAFGLGGMTNVLHDEQLNAFPEEVKQEAVALVEWTQRLRRRFGRRVRVRLVDALSLCGFWLTLRHRARCYPFFVIGGDVKRTGLDWACLDAAIADRLASA
jgi:hypothetical protein